MERALRSIHVAHGPFSKDLSLSLSLSLSVYLSIYLSIYLASSPLSFFRQHSKSSCSSRKACESTRGGRLPATNDILFQRDRETRSVFYGEPGISYGRDSRFF